MMTVLGCIVEYHDLWLVLVAALVCIAGSWGTVRLFARATGTTATERVAWLVLASVVAGAAIWCTHFIAMLGYNPGLPVGFDPVLTIVSLLAAIMGTSLGLAVAASGFTRFTPEIGGGVVGLSIVFMHYTGMMAYRVRGVVSWDTSYLITSIILSVFLSAVAFHIATRRETSSRSYWAAGVFVLAIIALHFTGMTAFRVEPMEIEGSFSNPEALRALAFAVAGVAFVVVGAGFASHLIDNRARAEAADALSNMSNGLVMIAGNSTIQLYNDRVLELFDLDASELNIGMSLEQYLQNVGARVGWDDGQTRRVIDNHGRWMTEATTTRVDHHFADGTILSITCQPVQGGGAIITYDNVTEAREGQKKIAHMAFHDALTGLPNRRSFADQVTHFAERSGFTLLMIDLDRFKAVNDTLGHAVGDKLLVAVAQRMKEVCGPSNLAFRLGGDEFGVIVSSRWHQAETIATEIVTVLSMPLEIGEHVVSIGCSVGIAVAEKDSDTQLVQQKADLALYKSKENGRGRVEHYRDGMIEEASQRWSMERDLAEAVEADQFELHYQPLFDLPGRALSGFEALVRWHHPKRGLVPPAEFIPIAEQCGAITEIGEWVIEAACRQAAQWPDHIYVSINVSPVQIRSTDILRQITEALGRHNLSPRRIEVEITETAMVENSKQIAIVLAGLRALGVRIAMDDFGTGYSSLAHLREFELDRIKIDRSFISASHTDSGATAVVRAVTGMARDLQIATTGEGVENEEQLAKLVALGCETAQGFLLGKPMDAASATQLIHGEDFSEVVVRAAKAG